MQSSEHLEAQYNDWLLVKRLARYLIQHRLLFFFALALYPCMALAVALPPYLVREVLDEIIPAKDLRALWVFGGLYLGALLTEYVAGFLSAFTMAVLGQRSMRSLRNELFEKVLRLPASFYDKNPVGRTLTRLTNDIDALGEVFSSGAISIVGDVITLVFILTGMLLLDVRLTLLALLVLPPMLFTSLVFRIFARRAFRSIRHYLAKINSFLAEHITAMNVIQNFNQQERTCSEFSELNGAYRNSNRRAIIFDAMLFAIVEAIGTSAVAIILWSGSHDMTSGVLGAGTLIAFAHLIRRFFIPLRDLSTKYTVLQSAFAAAERIFLLYDEPVTIQSPSKGKSISNIADAIEFRDVSFRYRTENPDDPWIIESLNLKVHKGERVALVGHTGCGKTTILKLLNRTYDIVQGSLMVDGTDIRDYKLQELRSLFTVVLQDVHLFAGTILENLQLGVKVGEEDAKKAIDLIGAKEMVDKMQGGFGAKVEELGTNLSAGERQVIALARALACNPEILVLDEATSNIDSETEAFIQQALELLLKDRTCVIVAHRLSTIQKADRIIVLDKGKIVEEGTHDSLMAKDALYKRFVQLHHASQLSQHSAA